MDAVHASQTTLSRGTKKPEPCSPEATFGHYVLMSHLHEETLRQDMQRAHLARHSQNQRASSGPKPNHPQHTHRRDVTLPANPPPAGESDLAKRVLLSTMQDPFFSRIYWGCAAVPSKPVCNRVKLATCCIQAWSSQYHSLIP